MKKVYILPNLVTTANMFCGFNAIVSAIQGSYLNAAWLIIVAMVFDLMDGRIARLTRATSRFGVEYDSLSDLISFGMAPAMVSYLWCLKPWGRMGWLVAFIYLIGAALRLARFNVFTDVVPKKYFQGLPSPIAAAGIATLIIFSNEIPLGSAQDDLVLGLLLFLGVLMISTIRFPSFKEFRIKRENAFLVLAAGIVILLTIALKPEVALFAYVYLYTVLGFLHGAYCWAFGKKDAPEQPTLFGDHL